MPKVHLSEMLPLMEEMLNQNGEVTFIPEGISMLPVIVGGKDSVTIKKPVKRLKKFDACLYVRKSGGFVLHRVIEVLPDSYVMSGDNQYVLEKGITDEQIIGLVVSVNKNGKEIYCERKAYKFYVRLMAGKPAKFIKKNLARVKNIKNKFFGAKK